MKAVLYSNEVNDTIESYGVRIDERAQYVPVLSEALAYNAMALKDARQEDRAMDITFFAAREEAIRLFLDAYDPKIRDPERYFDLTEAEAAYVARQFSARRDKRAREVAMALTASCAARNIFGLGLDKNPITKKQYENYPYVTAVGGVALGGAGSNKR